MLTVVLAVGDEIDGRESFGEIVPGRFALDAAAIGIAAPVEIDASEIAAILPIAFVDQATETGAIGAGLGAEHAMRRLALRVFDAHAVGFKRLSFGPDIGGDRIGLIGLVEFGDGADRAADDVHLGRKRIAE